MEWVDATLCIKRPIGLGRLRWCQLQRRYHPPPDDKRVREKEREGKRQRAWKKQIRAMKFIVSFPSGPPPTQHARASSRSITSGRFCHRQSQSARSTRRIFFNVIFGCFSVITFWLKFLGEDGFRRREKCHSIIFNNKISSRIPALRAKFTWFWWEKWAGGLVEVECLREISSIKICIAFIVSLDLMSALKAMTL